MSKAKIVNWIKANAKLNYKKHRNLSPNNQKILLKKIASFVLIFFCASVLSSSIFYVSRSDQSNNSSIPNNIVPDELIVKYKTLNVSSYSITSADQKNGVIEKESLFSNSLSTASLSEKYPLRSQRASFSTPNPNLSHVFRIKLQPNSDIEKIANKYRFNPNVEYVSYNYKFKKTLTPNDTFYNDQWYINTLNIPQAWDITTGQNSTVIAILDTGVRGNHEDLAGKVIKGYDFINNQPIQANSNSDDDGHGTACAGLAAGIGNNNKGIAGVDWGAKIMPVKVMGSNGEGSLTDIAKGIKFATDNGADIINLSVASILDDNEEKFIYRNLFTDALSYSHSAGVVNLAAAGNDAIDVSRSLPAALPYVITVGATNESNTLASFSNYGARIDVVAPGTNIKYPANNSNTQYDIGNGTSFSTPLVSGIVGLMISNNPLLTNEQIRQILRKTATDLGSTGFDYSYGYGLVNARAALEYAQNISTSFISNGGIIRTNQFPIKGTASGVNFQSFKIEYGVGSQPSTWNQIHSSTSPVTNNILTTWDVSSLSSGQYTIKLTVTNSNTTTSEFIDYIYLSHDLPSININTMPFTNNSSPTITGSTTANRLSDANRTIVNVYVGINTDYLSTQGVILTNTADPATKNFSFSTSNLPDGTHYAAIATVDNTNRFSYDSMYFTVDTIAPTPPIITSHQSNAVINSEFITVSGTSEINSKVELFINDSLEKSTTTNNNGYWSIDNVELANGENSIKVRAIDQAQNTSNFSTPIIIVNNFARDYFEIAINSENITADEVFSITVTAKNENEETQTDYTGSVNFTSSDPNAVLPGSYEFTVSDEGTKNFDSLKLFKAGVVTINITDGERTGSKSITVLAGEATTITKTSGDSQLGYIYRNLPNPVSVKITDDFENALEGIDVNFKVNSEAEELIEEAVVQTNAQGIASKTIYLGETPGDIEIIVSAIDKQVVFSATAQPFPNNVNQGTGNINGVIKSDDTKASVSFPSDSVNSSGLVTIVDLQSNIPAAPSGKKIVSKVYSFLFEKEEGGYLTSFGPNYPTISIGVDANLLTNTKENTALIYYWDEDNLAWSTSGISDQSHANNVSQAKTSHFSYFAVISDATTMSGEPNTPSVLPTAGSVKRLLPNLLLSIALFLMLNMINYISKKRQHASSV